ncbi:MAG TPA: ComF family protein [Candidatus Saccharimonadia bacterium]|nr:ComF family protein [Candidatus Saccharimonadia bacterium]
MGRIGWVDGLVRRIAHELLPPCCVLCGLRGAGRDLCAGCRAALPTDAHCCPRCALPLAHAAAACGACLARPPAWRAMHVPFRYAWPLDRLVARYKYGGDLAAGALLSALLAEHVRSRVPDIDAIVPVPLSHARLRARGFNQALELSRPLARALSLGMPHRALWRCRETSAQSGLDAEARRRNVRGAFAASRDVAGCRIALVDDVVTTGATAAACTRALHDAGARSVEVWAVARAPPPSSSSRQAGASA